VHVRVVRFTGVSAEHVDKLVAEINAAGGAPPGVPNMGMQLLFDEAQGTALSVQQYASAEDMAAAAKVFEAMDASETPGDRVSVDSCELKLDIPLS
jgi:hypothetical protein